MLEKPIKLDAKNKQLGRLASEVAVLLNGKGSPSYTPRIGIPPEKQVMVINVSQLAISNRKKKGMIYDRYSGYFGGRKEEKFDEVVRKKGYSEIFRRAVYGMLADNRLRAKKMKHLIIQE